jgi:diguanylate cyclase (GGDEF)-like protein
MNKPTYEELEERIQFWEDRKPASQQANDNFFTVLNSIDATVYVSDMDTYEILYVNNYMVKSFGKNVTGEMCYKVFRNEDKPCPDCTNRALVDDKGKPAGLIVWDGENCITHKWYMNYDRAIEWNDGRIVRLQIATDITELKNAHSTIKKMSITDDLTQISNRRCFLTRLDKEVQRSQRYMNPLSLVMVDVDHFKKINDGYGHQIGDEVLIKVASILKSNVRKVDTVARYGGEEFAILLPETSGEIAYRIGEKLRKLIAEHKFNIIEGKEFNVTACFGISSLEHFSNDGKKGVKWLIKQSDNALYDAKHKGRNLAVLL